MVSTNPGPHGSSECRTSVEACGEKQNSLLFAGFSLSPWPFLLELKTADQNGRCECSQICLEVHVAAVSCDKQVSVREVVPHSNIPSRIHASSHQGSVGQEAV